MNGFEPILTLRQSAEKREGVGLPAEQTPPFTTFVVKIFERCNLNCTYCYMYNLADKSFELRPTLMSTDVRDQFLQKLRQHTESHHLQFAVIVLHGGEPMLAGIDYLRDWISAAQKEFIDSKTHVLIRLQTNGLLIDSDWIELFSEFDVRIGISLDGPRAENDRFRIDHRGNGSFDRVVERIQTLVEHPKGDLVFGAILSVANPLVPAREMWDFWLGLGVTRFDFNLPHCHHDAPPWFELDSLKEWMRELFDIWWEYDNPNYEIRFFRNILNLLLGSPVSTDYIGGKPGGIAVVETDGSIHGPDALRSCEDGLTDLHLDLMNNTFDDALRIDLVRLANHSSAQLADKCEACVAREICGGGYLAHRYSREKRFDNPSVYCDVLYDIIHYIRDRILDGLSDAQIANLGLQT